jgi:molybdopterin/thiamine biosynthesis adenylyltransferase/nitroreductase
VTATPRFLASEARARPAPAPLPAPAPFDYATAFSRNIGWITEWEQQALRGKCVAIAGLGGVGGVHLLTLARFGIGAFHIADLDRFELANFNRQVGATLDTIGRPKVDVLEAMARQINPELNITSLPAGVQDDTIDAFLAGADLFIDGFDFFVLDLRRRVHARCAELGIPAIIAAPLGMGTAFLVFRPGGMSFDAYFRLGGLSPERQAVNFLLGLAPKALHRHYLVDPSRVDLRAERGPSTPAACELCAGVASVEAIKLLLGRGRVRAAPYYHQFDPFAGKWVTGRLPGGNRNPLQRLKIALARRMAAKLSDAAIPVPPRPAPLTEIEAILDDARWAPSGDNTQPWRFEATGAETVTLYLTNQSAHDVYDYRDGEPSLLAGGALLESIAIAASVRGRDLEWRYQGQTGHRHRIELGLPRRAGLAADPLYASVPLRSVNRRPYRLTPLSTQQRRELEAALGDALEIVWHESAAERWRLARLGGKATGVRLGAPEAFPVHQRVIDWRRAQSPDAIPAAAAGLMRISLPAMRWALKSWRRMRLLNAVGSRVFAAAQMDYIPGFMSAAYFTLRLSERDGAPAARAVQLLEAGREIQRFWLTATRLGLALQPAMGTLIFADYGAVAPTFSLDPGTRRRTTGLAAAFTATLGDCAPIVFMGRIGVPRHPPRACRSTRRPVGELITGRDVQAVTVGNSISSASIRGASALP